MKKIFVTKPFLPPKSEYIKFIDKIYDNSILTNQGPLLKELELELKKYLDVRYLHYVTNGTVALQLALKALNIEDGEIITTPFTYVATISSILWERCTPIFVDIEPNNFTIDYRKIEEKITEKTRAIMPVHVFGYACNVEQIDEISKKYNLPVIYDAAHTFGSKYKGKSLSSYGTISTLSFHATKLFHTIEGGACVVNSKNLSDSINLLKKFGHEGEEYFTLGINAKQDEFNSAMGLLNLKYVNYIIDERKRISCIYDSLLSDLVQRPKEQEFLQYNYSYYPVLFKDESTLLKVLRLLNDNQIFPRRYFYPSLNKLPYINCSKQLPISENISSRVACMPLYIGLSDSDVSWICDLIDKVI